MKKVRDLLLCDSDILIEGITDDSRLVKKNYLFVATKGYNVDHLDYIQDAIEKGCSFIVCDQEIDLDFPHLVVDNTHDTYIKVCQEFYDIDLDSFHFIGITGTDGKTTTSTIIKDLLDSYAYIGTNGVQVGDQCYGTSNTTPCISELYDDLNLIQKTDCHSVAMEVSSEALLHHRVDGFQFDVVGFTNITGDHLNIHKSFENYISCKMELLNYVKPDGYIVYNGDDKILQSIQHPNSVSFGFNSSNNYVIESVHYQSRKTVIQLSYDNNSWEILSPLVGEYNVYNVVMAFIVGRLHQVDDSLLLNRIQDLRPIKGRGEFLDFGQKYDIVLDYAHTINGIQSVLNAFQDYDMVITVTGCAGGREKEKRSTIGKIVMEYSDIAIFTMDDPRYEDVDTIIDEMVGDSKDYYRIIDREDAICFALTIAPPNSVVLILGKGRDNYMAIEDKKIHYSDYDVISHYFKGE